MVKVFRKRYIIEAIAPKLRLLGIDVYYEFLNQLTNRIGMHTIVPPIIVKIPVDNAFDKHLSKTDDCGFSAAMIWLESGVQIHAWSEHSFVSIDIYSCKDFSTDVVDDLFTLTFQPTQFVRKEVV